MQYKKLVQSRESFGHASEGIHAIVGGDTHSLLDSTGRLEEIDLAPKYGNQTGAFAGYDHRGFDDEPLGSYPTMVTGPNGDPVAIVQAWEYAYGLGVLHVDFRADGTVDEFPLPPFLRYRCH